MPTRFAFRAENPVRVAIFGLDRSSNDDTGTISWIGKRWDAKVELRFIVPGLSTLEENQRSHGKGTCQVNCFFRLNCVGLADDDGIHFPRRQQSGMKTPRLLNHAADRPCVRGIILPAGFRPTGAVFAALMFGESLAKVRVKYHLTCLNIGRG